MVIGRCGNILKMAVGDILWWITYVENPGTEPAC